MDFLCLLKNDFVANSFQVRELIYTPVAECAFIFN